MKIAKSVLFAHLLKNYHLTTCNGNIGIYETDRGGANMNAKEGSRIVYAQSQ